GLAVYASPGGLPHHDARLASSRWSDATGRAFHPQGSDERFQSACLHLVPLSRALPGAIPSTEGRSVLIGTSLGSVSLGGTNMAYLPRFFRCCRCCDFLPGR